MFRAGAAVARGINSTGKGLSMDARTYPRTRLSVPVRISCSRRNSCHNRITSDISPGGLFVNGSPCGRAGSEFDVCMDCAELEDPLCLSALIAHIVPSGFGMQFTKISSSQLLLLENVIQPNWDGKDAFEGLMIFAAREQTVGLADWLRLTSLVSGDYQRRALSHSRTKNEQNPGSRGT